MKLIVGIDPGTTTAVAVVDISSDFYKVISKKFFSRGEVAQFVVDNGIPIVVAGDVKKPSGFLKKISATFGARLFYPRYDISVKEKNEITKEFHYENNHERDALAAALFAKNNFSSILSKVSSAAEKKGVVHLADDIKEMLIKEQAGNIDEAIKILTKEEVARTSEPRIKERTLQELQNKIKLLLKERANLIQQIVALQAENKRLKNEAEYIKSKIPKKEYRKEENTEKLVELLKKYKEMRKSGKKN